MGILGNQFFPETDNNEFTITINAAPGSSLEQTSNICSHVENELKKFPEVKTVLTTIGAGNDPVTRANILVKLVSKNERKKNDKILMAQLRNKLRFLPGANISYGVQGGPGGGGKPVEISIRGDNIERLSNYADKIEAIVKSTRGTVDVENSLETSKPEIRLLIDRAKASDLGVNPMLIAGSVRSMVDGYVATQYQEGDEQFDVRVRLKKENRTDITNIPELMLKSTKKADDGGSIMIPVTEVARASEGVGPSEINRYARQKEIRISANLSGRFLGDALSDIQNETKKINFEPGYSASIVGEGEMQAESFGNIFLSFGLAIVFVYIVLAAQFESIVHPFSIMLALPMAMIGAVLLLLIFGSSLSVVSLIGIIMLMGLVTKNGILLVDYTNVLRGRGLTRFDALLKAGPTRLRPILMTTFAMVFGMMPVALGLGEGGDFRAPMGQAVIGGLITSTLLTLFIVPVVYTLLDDISIKYFVKLFKRIFQKKNKL